MAGFKLVKILELNGAIQAFVPSSLVVQHDFTSMFWSCGSENN